MELTWRGLAIWQIYGLLSESKRFCLLLDYGDLNAGKGRAAYMTILYHFLAITTLVRRLLSLFIFGLDIWRQGGVFLCVLDIHAFVCIRDGVS